MLTTLWLILKTELILKLRRSQEWLYPLGFFCIVIAMFPLALTPDPKFLEKFIPGFIWIAALLASLLSVENIFSTDLEDGFLEQLTLSSVPLSLSLLTKLFAQWLVSEVSLIILTPLLGLMFHLSSYTVFILCLSLVVGTPILTLIGSFAAALALGLPRQGMMLGLLILPLLTPVLIFGVNIVQQAQAGFSIIGPLAFLAGLSLFSLTLLPGVIAATLRISLDA